ncbi:MAG: transcriptional repressor [Deltaproteobacteria bacterium]|nr:MAG: transcriptional repressor [Deltaproteobacteria bacterium]
MNEPSPQHHTLYERLRERGWRMTAQRRVVAQALAGEHVHMTADEVFRAAQADLPELSLATVYNTLNDLVAMGEVREVAYARGPTRYDPNAVTPHDHLVCVVCGEIRDISTAPGVTLDDDARQGFEVLGAEVVYRGRCPACRAA